MNNSEIDSLHLDSLPHNISNTLSLTISESNYIRKLDLLIHSYRQIVHFYALCHISDYIRYPHIRCSEGEEILIGLKRPSLGHWVRVIRDIPRIFLKQSITLFIEEWIQEYEALDSLRYNNCIGYDLFSSRISLTGIEAFLRLRNTLAHGAVSPEQSVCQDIYEQYLFILKDILYTLQSLKKLTVYRVVEQNVSGLNVVALKGRSQTFTSIFLQRSENCKYTGEANSCFLQKDNSSEFLQLDPMLISSLPEQEQDNTIYIEPLLSYDGIGNKCAYYLGVRRKFESKIYYPDVVDTLFTKSTAKPSLWNTEIATLIINITLESISVNRGAKYFPEVYQERERYSALVQEFIQSSSHKISGLLLIAESGTGKTSLMCHTALKLLSVERTDILPLFIMSRNLIEHDGLKQQIYQSGDLGALGIYLIESLGFKNAKTWEELISTIESNMAKSLDKNDIKLVLIIDAINEAPDPFHLIQEFDYVVKLARGSSWLRCIGTIRKGSYESLLSRLSNENIKYPRNERSYVRESDDSGKLSIAINLFKFSDFESKFVYETYQRQSKHGIDVPSCITLYQDLPETLRTMIQNPLVMRVLMQTYNGQKLPSNFVPTNLFRYFHDRHLTPSQAETVTFIARKCFQLKQPYLSQSEAQNIIDLWESNKGEYITFFYLNPVEQLLDLGILIRNMREEYIFAHQLYFEFLIFDYFSGLNFSQRSILEKTFEIVVTNPDGHLEEEVGAIRMLLIERLKQKDYELIESLVGFLNSEIFYSFFVLLVFELQSNVTEAYVLIKECILQQLNTEILTRANRIFKLVGDREIQILITQKILKVEKDPVKKAFVEAEYIRLLIMSNQIYEAESFLQNLKCFAEDMNNERLILSACIEEGYLNVVTGNSQKALLAYSKALNMLETIKNELENEDYLILRRKILGGRGCVEHNIDDNLACTASHVESLKINRQLQDKPAIALDLVNIADAHWGCHRYGLSLRTYRDAIEVSTKACYQDAMDVALICRGIVLWSIGYFEEASSSINAGLEIAKQLNYSWDLAYGLIYQSNIQSSTGYWIEGIETNKEALLIAQKLGAEYLVALASGYLFWKYEVTNPGTLSNRQSIESALLICKNLSLKGIEIMLISLQVLNYIPDKEIDDDRLKDELDSLIGSLERMPLVKGIWEIIGLHLIGAFKRWRTQIPTLDLEDIVDEICERKASSLDPEHREIFFATRKAWKPKTK